MDRCSSARETLCYQILDACVETTRASDDAQPPPPYNRPLLLRLFCDLAQPADGSRDRFLDAFCERVGLSGGEGRSLPPPTSLTVAQHAAAEAFADELVDDLFLPLKAVGARSSDGFSADQNCPGADADTTLVCIFPPSPMTIIDDDGDFSPAGQTAAQMLSMLDGTAVATLQRLKSAGEGAASAASAASAQSLQILHNTVMVPAAHACAFLQFAVLDEGVVQDPHKLSDGVSSRLLALHRSVARILHETGAGAHIDSILRDTGTEDLLADGTTRHLGRLMQLRLDGWWDGRGRQGGGGSRSRSSSGSGWWVDHGQLVEERPTTTTRAMTADEWWHN